MTSPWTNWAGTEHAIADRVAHPTSIDDVAGVVRAAAEAGQAVKAVGSGHSFTSAAVTSGVRIELDRLADTVAVDPSRRRVTVQAGMRLSRLNAVLAQHALALPNLGDIDAQTVAGALATGTHGTGARLGCLSTFIETLTLVTAAGEVVTCSAEVRPEIFRAAQVNVGALGVVCEVTLRCVPAFVLRADERPGTLADVWSGLTEDVAGNEHMEFYWFPYTDRVQVKRNNRVEARDAPLAGWRRWLDDDFLSNTVLAGACRVARALPATAPVISRVSAHALAARTYTAASHEVFCTPRRVRFVEMEYGLPRLALREAFAALQSIVDSLATPVLFPVEVRFTAADDIWLSHSYGRDSAYIAIHQYVGTPFEEYFRRFEEVAIGLDGRPHWGKVHFRDAASLAGVYPRFRDFLAVRDKLDPGRAFANPYTERVFGA